LITINQELQMRNEQLVEVQEYSEAVFTTIREALLILDKNLRIKNANSRFYKTFRLTEEEVEGKILYELGNKQWNIPRLKELLEDVIPRNSQVSDFEIAHTFENIGEKVMLLSARRLVRRLHSEHLILVAIEDITEHRKAQRLVTEREEWFRNMADNAPIMIWVADTGKRLQFVNKAWLEYRGLQLREAIGQSWVEKMHTEDDNRVAKIFDDAFTRKIPFETQYRLRYGSDYKTIHSKGKPNFDHNHKFLGFIGSCVELPGETVK
jgi:two-component system, chemotaxis family, CheB/CheR fusion protein